MPAFVQLQEAVDSTTPKEPSVAMATTAGNALVAALYFGGASGAGNNVTDLAGSTWTRIVQDVTGNGVSLHYCLNPSVASTTITGSCTDTTSPFEAVLRVAEFQGITGPPFDSGSALYNFGSFGVAYTPAIEVDLDAVLVSSFLVNANTLPMSEGGSGFTKIGAFPYQPGFNVASGFFYKFSPLEGQQQSGIIFPYGPQIVVAQIAAFPCSGINDTVPPESPVPIGRGAMR